MAFLAATIVVFFMTLSAADSIGFVPCAIDDTCPNAVVAPHATMDTTSTTLPALQEASTASQPPVRIKIPAIDLDLPVQNPTTTDLGALDELLKQGPARHALSGLLGDDRNMIIFGHSSHLPIVHNQMYKAFNQVPNLKAGDQIELDGEGGGTYLYSVTSVTKADATNFGENFLGTPEKKLIIVTCDTLTSKSARYIVRADFVGLAGQ
jgi:LPXTG-site transpeptidase (sortase) family protein